MMKKCMTLAASASISIFSAASLYTRPLVGQDPESVEASASTAREAWQDVRSAFGNGDLDAASEALRRATGAWPTQVAYQRARAMVAARLGDQVALKESLEALISMQSNDRLMGDSAVISMRTDRAIDSALNRLEAATAPLVRSVSWRTIPDTTFYAEGVDADPRSGAVYVASIRHRTVFEIDSTGAVRDLNLARHSEIGAVFGVRMDPSGGSLWITTSTLPAMEGFTSDAAYIAAVVRVRITDGAIQRVWDLRVEGERPIPGDLAVSLSGDVFVTDSRLPRLIRVRPESDDLEITSNRLFRSLQGVATHSDGRHVYVADYSHGILRLDLATGRVIRLADAPGTTSLGIDGIVLYGNAIVAVQNGVAPPRIVRFELDSAGERITDVKVIDRHLPLADEPTIGTLLNGDFVYVANSQWEKYDDSGNRRPGSTLAPTVLLKLPLDP